MKYSMIIFLVLLFFVTEAEAQHSFGWQRSYNPLSNNNQSASDVAADDAGNSYLLGYTGRGYNGTDVALVKYSPAGNILWARSFDGGNEFNSDLGKSLVLVKNGGNTFVYAACVISVSGYGNQAGLLKYDSSGNLLWSAKMPPGYNASVTAVASDQSGNVFVCGGTSAEAYVAKFDPDGDSLWLTKLTQGAGYINGVVNDIVTDSLGNVYGTGKSSNPNVTNDDLIAFKLSPSGSILWSRLYAFGNYTDAGNALSLRHGSLTITGRGDNSGSVADILTVKLNSATGDSLWSKKFNGTSNLYDNSFDIEMDANGNIFIAGQTDGATYAGDAIALKYNSSGALQWTRKFAGLPSMEDVFREIRLDSLGNVYAAGRINFGAGANFIAVKYNTAGDSLWTRLYNFGTTEEAFAMVLDKDLNVIVAGECDNYDMACLKYNSGGALQWARKFTGAQLYADYVNSLVTDKNGNVYVAGKTRVSQYGDQFTVIKYDSAGNQKWLKSYGVQLYDNYDEAKAITIDKNGYLYVTGTSRSRFNNLSLDFLTFKLDTAGNQYWYAIFNGSGNGDDDAKAIAVDSSGNVLVAGESRSAGATIDYCVVKYSPSGTKLWERYYDGTGGGADYAYDICTDPSGNVYVTGQSFGGSTGDDIATIRYNSAGTQVWVQRHNGAGNGFDFANTIELDKAYNVYVSGSSRNSANNSDIALIKYRNDNAGTQAWAKYFSAGTTGFESATGMKFDTSRTRIYLDGTAYFDDPGASSFIAKYDTSGYRMWYTTGFFYGNSDTYSMGIELSADEKIYKCLNRVFPDGTTWLVMNVRDSSGNTRYEQNFDTAFAWSDGYSPNFKDAIGITPSGRCFIGYGDMDTTAGVLMSIVSYNKALYRLDVNAFIQGFYDPSSNSMVQDTVTAFIRFFNSPSYIVDSSKAVLNSAGQAAFYFDGLFDAANYYVALRHRNAIETWSSGAVTFPQGVASKNFTSASGDAYGNNLVQIDASPLRFGFYSGDVNQDETVDATDLALIDNAAYNFSSGYIPTDVNGDEFIDATDYSIADNNAYNFISAIYPNF